MAISGPELERAIAGTVRAWADEHLAIAQSYKVNAFGRGEIELRSKQAEATGEALILMLQFNDAKRHVYLTNIFLPQSLRRRGIGKALMAAIRAAANARGYHLFATDIVTTFYERLVRRGAAIVIEDDMVMITPETDLTHHHD
jgi:GNAT superfamily N-acetyltransferase